MILFFRSNSETIYAVELSGELPASDIEKLTWLFDDAKLLNTGEIKGDFIGTRREMITPWSTNAVEITQNMGIKGILRIEEFTPTPRAAATANALPNRTAIPSGSSEADFDHILQHKYSILDQNIFTINKQPEPVLYIDDIQAYNQKEGLALNAEEIDYLNNLSKKLGRRLTDSEIFGFSQVNSEHCRHKIFNGTFIIDGKEEEFSLFKLIKQTSVSNPNNLVSAYKDNVAFNSGPAIQQFAPRSGDKPDFFELRTINSVLSLKAETHNFPTTVEPFNGAATGTGGEIRDRLGGGKASLPLAGTAVYMTSYPTGAPTHAPTDNESKEAVRGWHGKDFKWLYQTPEQILIKASNGASDFGNKFGQPLICGSLFTFEHAENEQLYGYDKVIMLAGGVGFANQKDALKDEAQPNEKIVVMGGDNYRIGMGGGAVSSVDTGNYGKATELNAVQRSNPEMQKRVANVIRTLAESGNNPIVSIHDHGAGGHLNCLSELVETTGGYIEMDKLPIGDTTLSAKEIIGNESQERMGLLLQQQDIQRVKMIAERERAPFYVVGQTTGDKKLIFAMPKRRTPNPIDLSLKDFFGNPPQTIIRDNTVNQQFEKVDYSDEHILQYLTNVLKMESVACKDWLTNKVDRSVTGKVALQQCAGEIQLPLNNLGVVALDYTGTVGIAMSIGHAPVASLVDAAKGTKLAIAEALTNIVWADLKDGLKSISLSANWMWACKNRGEDARLYSAVKTCSDFACKLGINIPTGKDSLSMTQKYEDGTKALAPGTLIVSASAEVADVQKVVRPVMVKDTETFLYYIDFSHDKLKLGGSTLAQTLGRVGEEAPDIADTEYFKSAFMAIQTLVNKDLILAGHDISGGGMITALLEMCFANENYGLYIDLKNIAEKSLTKILFAENTGIIIQIKNKKAVDNILKRSGIAFVEIGKPIEDRRIEIVRKQAKFSFSINQMRDLWYETSYLFDKKQSGETCSKLRFENYKKQPLKFVIPAQAEISGDNQRLAGQVFTDRRKPVAAIIREKGTNGEREMAYALHLAGFAVKDVHMTDLITGRETLENVNFIVFCGGFSNSDVLGSAKGWAGAFLYNEKAKNALENFYNRNDTLSLGICNGCQLMIELSASLHSKEREQAQGANRSDNTLAGLGGAFGRAKMLRNDSRKFESAFIAVQIPPNNSVMLGSLSGLSLGVWVAHGEGKFCLPESEEHYNIALKYACEAYPANPNGSDYSAAAICSADGRHLAMMPHPERAIFPWQWAYFPANTKTYKNTAWLTAFENARKWISG
ncbi:MAG: phosphoribosylformylglycinamidine synthase [Prevotellaceae bacterium]|jgi:phosphoribosylformylglycinamidine synthase|nr:phosphoribosylformylglycinamidine synthase [Prevotellaceae bacterium]